MKRKALFGCVLALGACKAQLQAEARSGSGDGAAAQPAEPVAKEPKVDDDKSEGRSVSVGFHKEGKVSVKIDWQGRSGQLCRASSPYKFVGLAKLAGTAQLTATGLTGAGHAEASGASSGGETTTSNCAAPRSPIPPTPAPVPVTHPAKPEPAPPKPTKVEPTTTKDAKPTVPKAEPQPTIAKEPVLPPPPEPAPEPTPTELEKPQEPPAKPPDNVFGYEKPVRGCFEGQVFPLAANTRKLPNSYEKLKPISVVYACEWDISPRAWDQGFPGVADRFEWFAIRYAGAFYLADAGEYSFRLSSDDGVKVIIDGKVVLNNDGVHPPKQGRGKVQLTKGDHQMVLEYFQGPRFEINLQLWVTPPGKQEELFTVR